MRRALCIGLILIFIACSGHQVPKGVLEPGKMEKVVYDILKVEEYVNTFVAKDTTLNVKKQRSTFYAEVFKLHNTNRKEFYSSYKYYQQHPDMQKALFDSISAEAGRATAVFPHRLPAKAGKLKQP